MRSRDRSSSRWVLRGRARTALTLAAVCVTCGSIAAVTASSGASAARANGVGGPGGPPPAPPTTSANRQAAIRDVNGLLDGVVAPPGAVLDSSSSGVARPHTPLLTETLDSAVAEKTWTVRADYRTVLSFVAAHLPPGSKLYGTVGGGGPQPTLAVIRIWPTTSAQLGIRLLRLLVTATGSETTLLSAAAQSQWIVERPASERIPAGVRAVTVVSGVPGRRPFVSRTVTGRGRVQTLVRLFDSLPIVQRTVISCPAELAHPPLVTVTFKRSATGPAVASARAAATAGVGTPPPPYNAGWACSPVEFSILGHRRAALAGNVVRPIQRLLHIKLTRPHG